MNKTKELNTQYSPIMSIFNHELKYFSKIFKYCIPFEVLLKTHAHHY